jgi:hypothetical protein
MSAKQALDFPDGSVDSSQARPRRLSSVADPASQTSGPTEVFAVDWQLADQLSDIS